MPFCTNCGKQLAENEVCNCKLQKNSDTPKSNPTPPPIVVNAQGKPMYDQLGRPLFTPQGQPITYDENGNPKVKKDNSGCIIAIVVCLLIFLLVGGILVAIFVPAMLGYVGKAKTQQANADAKTIISAVNCALTEMDEKGFDVNATFVVSSDESENLFCSTIDTDTLYKTTAMYTDISSTSDWFVVIENGVATYCAVENDDYIGTYPYRSSPRDKIPTYNGGYVSSDADLDDVYAASCKNLIPIDYNDIF